jgi:hypothetical protein
LFTSIFIVALPAIPLRDLTGWETTIFRRYDPLYAQSNHLSNHEVVGSVRTKSNLLTNDEGDSFVGTASVCVYRSSRFKLP